MITLIFWTVIWMTLDWWYLVIYHFHDLGGLHTSLFGCLCQSWELNPGQESRWILRGAKTTLRFGLHRPSVTGPIFVYRVCTALRQETPTRMQVLSHADLSPDHLLSAIAGQHPDLRDTWADGGWQLCAIDATRGHSRDRSLMHPCYVLIQADDYWAFNHRPHGLLELVLGSLDLSFPCVLPQMINFPVLPSVSVATPSSWASVPLASACGTMGPRWTIIWSAASMASLYRSLWK